MAAVWIEHKPLCLQAKSSIRKNPTFKPAFMEPRAEKKKKQTEVPTFPGDRTKRTLPYRAPASGSMKAITAEMNKIYGEGFVNSRAYREYQEKSMQLQDQIRAMDAEYEDLYPERMAILREADARLASACEGLVANMDTEQMIVKPQYQNKYAKEISDILAETFVKLSVRNEEQAAEALDETDMTDEQLVAMISSRLDLIINCYNVEKFYRYQEDFDVGDIMLEGKRDRQPSSVVTKRQKIVPSLKGVPQYKIYQAIDHVTNLAVALQLSQGMPETMSIVDSETKEMKILQGKQREEFYYLKARSALARNYDFPIPNPYYDAGLEDSLKQNLAAKLGAPKRTAYRGRTIDSDEEDSDEESEEEPQVRRSPAQIAPAAFEPRGWGGDALSDLDVSNWHAAITTDNSTIFSEFEHLKLSARNDVKPSREIRIDPRTKQEKIVYDTKTAKLFGDSVANQSSEQILQDLEELIAVREKDYKLIVDGWLKLEAQYKREVELLNYERSARDFDLKDGRKKLAKLKKTQVLLTQFTNAKVGTEAYIEKLKEHRKNLYRKLNKLDKYMGSIPWRGGLVSVALSAVGFYTLAKLPTHFKALHEKVTQYRIINGKDSESYLSSMLLFGSILVTQFALLPFLAAAFNRVIQSPNVDREDLDKTIKNGVERLRTSAQRVQGQLEGELKSLRSSAEAMVDMVNGANNTFRIALEQDARDLNLFTKITDEQLSAMPTEELIQKFILTGHLKAVIGRNMQIAYNADLTNYLQEGFEIIPTPIAQGSFTSPAAVEGSMDLLGGATRINTLFSDVVENQACNISVSNAVTGEFMSTTCNNALPGLLNQPQYLTVQHTLPGAKTAVKTIAEAAERLRVAPELLQNMQISDKTTAAVTVLESTSTGTSLPIDNFSRIPPPPISVGKIKYVTKKQVLDALEQMPNLTSPFGPSKMTDLQKRLFVQTTLTLQDAAKDESMREKLVRLNIYGTARLMEKAQNVEQFSEIAMKLSEEQARKLLDTIDQLKQISKKAAETAAPMNDILDKLATTLNFDTLQYPAPQLAPKSAALFERILKKRMLESMDSRFLEDFSYLPESPTKVADMVNWFSRLHPDRVDAVVNETVQIWTVTGGQELHMKEMAPYLVSRHFLLPDGKFTTDALEALKNQGPMFTVLGHLKYMQFQSLQMLTRYFNYSGLGFWQAVMTPESWITYALNSTVNAIQESWSAFRDKTYKTKEYKQRQAWRSEIATLEANRKQLKAIGAAREQIVAIDAKIAALKQKLGTKFDDQDAATAALSKFHKDFEDIVKADAQRIERACSSVSNLLGASIKTIMSINRDMQVNLLLATVMPNITWFTSIFASLFGVFTSLISFGDAAVTTAMQFSGAMSTLDAAIGGNIGLITTVVVGTGITLTALATAYFISNRINTVTLAIFMMESAKSVLNVFEKTVSLYSFLKSIYSVAQFGSALTSFDWNPSFKAHADAFFNPKPVFMVEELLHSYGLQNPTQFAAEVNRRMLDYCGFDSTTFAPEFKQGVRNIVDNAKIGDYVEGMMKTMRDYGSIEGATKAWTESIEMTGAAFGVDMRGFTPIMNEITGDLTGVCNADGSWIGWASQKLGENLDSIGKIISTASDSYDPEVTKVVATNLLGASVAGYTLLRSGAKGELSKAELAAQSSANQRKALKQVTEEPASPKRRKPVPPPPIVVDDEPEEPRRGRPAEQPQKQPPPPSAPEPMTPRRRASSRGAPLLRR